MSVPVDWKPERAIQAKIRDMQKYIFPVDWKPERAIQAKVRDSKKKKRKRKKYTQKKNNDYLKGELEWYLGSVQKWRLFAKLRSIGLYPEGVLVKGLYPDNVCIFSSDIIPIQSYQVFVLWCWAAFGPAYVCLLVLPLYCPLSFIHMHSCIHSMHTDIIHTWLHCQSYF